MLKRIRTDVLVLGSGFGGSLIALILNKLGREVVVVDRARHPRLAIGESSTPLADFALRRLATRYDLPQLLPFAQYGTWCESYPLVARGLKRGFSYFRHQPDTPFVADANRQNELLVAASATDEQSDTHWYRPEFDAHLVEELRRAGIAVIEEFDIHRVEHDGDFAWRFFSADAQVHCRFAIDATGAGGVLPQQLNLREFRDELHTKTRALFGHFQDVTPWDDVYRVVGGDVADHPFRCDAAAVHHLLAEGWMWQLRFDNGITSCGLVLDDLNPKPASPQDEWNALVSRYPSLETQLRAAELVAPPTGLAKTSRLQRWHKETAGVDWLLLPHTAGFIDPMHSTGIAQTLTMIELCSMQFEADRWDANRYAIVLEDEFRLIDLLVAGCQRTRVDFRRFAAWTMLYFVCAIRAEQTAGTLAGDEVLLSMVERLFAQIANTDVEKFEQQIREAIAPWNSVGLLEPAAKNMYHHTAAR